MPSQTKCQTRGEGNRGPERLLLGGLERKPSSTWGSLQPPPTYPPKRDREAAPRAPDAIPCPGGVAVLASDRPFHPAPFFPETSTSDKTPVCSPPPSQLPCRTPFSLRQWPCPVRPSPSMQALGTGHPPVLVPTPPGHPPHLAASVWVTVTSVLPAFALNTAGTRRASPHPWL